MWRILSDPRAAFWPTHDGGVPKDAPVVAVHLPSGYWTVTTPFIPIATCGWHT